MVHTDGTRRQWQLSETAKMSDHNSTVKCTQWMKISDTMEKQVGGANSHSRRRWGGPHGCGDGEGWLCGITDGKSQH